MDHAWKIHGIEELRSAEHANGHLEDIFKD